MYYRTILLYKQTIKKGGPNLNNFITDMHEPCLQLVGFKESAVPKSFNPVGNFYELNDNCGKGFYWVYGNSNKYTITLQECSMNTNFNIPLPNTWVLIIIVLLPKLKNLLIKQ